MKIGQRLNLGFGLIVAAVIVLGIIADNFSGQISAQTTNLYEHPFTVTAALADANTNIVAMHRSMKDVALAANSEEMEKAVADVNTREKRVYEKFDIARERFLGDKSDFEAAAKAFADWKPIRDEVIQDFRDGHKDEAATITKTKGAAQVAQINKTMDKIISFALNKAEAFMKNAQKANDQSRMTLLATTIVIAVLGGGIAFLITRGINRPIVQMTTVMREMSNGNKQIAIPSQDARDEIGDMAKAMQIFKESMIRAESLEKAAKAEQERELARGRQRETLTADFDKVIRNVIADVDGAVRQVHSTSTSLHAAANQTSQQSASVTTFAEQATTNIQTVASAAEQLGASTSEISRRVQDTTRITQEAVDGVQTADVTIDGLSVGAQKIGEIVSLINDIAAQTNLLALNATIEAARAGDAGKGFAVVANEVKSLANQTARATSEIAEQIGGIQTSTQNAVKAIKAVGGAIGQVDAVVSSIAAAVEEQNAATQEIVRNVQQAANGNRDISNSIGDVSTAAQATGDIAENMYKIAQALEESGTKLGTQVDTFLRTVKAV